MGNATTWLLAAPLWMVFLIYAARSVKDWPGIMQRRNERARIREEAKDGDWSRLRGEIDRHANEFKEYRAETNIELARLRAENKDCHSRLASAIERIAELEGYNIGIGEAKQSAQRMLSAGREADAKKRDAGK